MLLSGSVWCDGASQTGDEVQVRVVEVGNGKISLSMAPFKEGGGRQFRERSDRKPRDDGPPPPRRQREERVENIWNDTTEPNWKDFLNEQSDDADEFANKLELRL